jgi:hypothetical protein
MIWIDALQGWRSQSVGQSWVAVGGKTLKQSVCCAVGLLADGSLTVAEKRREWLGRKKLWLLLVQVWE